MVSNSLSLKKLLAKVGAQGAEPKPLPPQMPGYYWMALCRIC